MKHLFKSKKKPTLNKIPGPLPVAEHVVDNQTASTSTSASGSSQPSAGSKAYPITLDVSSLILGMTKDISEFSSALGPLKAACSAVSRVIDLLRKIEKNQRAWAELAKRIETHLNRLQREVDRMTQEQAENQVDDRRAYPRDKDVDSSMTAYLQKLQEILEIANSTAESRKGAKGFFKNAALATVDEEEIAGFSRQLDSNFQDFTAALSSYVADQVRRIAQEAKQIVLLMKLKEAPDSARGNDKHCAPGTRGELLDRLRVWGLKIETLPRVLLISDVAGSGKSTVANHISDEWLESGHLVGRFYFSSEETDTSTTKCVCSQLARDIFTRYPVLLEKLSSILSNITSITSLRFPRQFQALVTEPLITAREAILPDAKSAPMILVFDALDECVEIKEFLNTLLTELRSLPFVKVVLTTRPDPHIDPILEASDLVGGGRDVALYLPSEPAQYRDRDVAAYIQQRLKGHEFFTVERVERLVERSAGLFLFASIACDELLKTWVREDTFAELLIVKPGCSNLDSLYINILQKALPNDKSTKVLIPVLQTLLAARVPISISTIERFLPATSQTAMVVKHLGSLMKDGTPHRPIHLVHATFREFLFEETRSGKFFIQPSVAHRNVAVQCLRTLLRHLHPDLCCLANPREPFPMRRYNQDVAMPPSYTSEQGFVPIKYALRFWADHAREAIRESEVQHYLKQFLEQALLFWIEWISILNLIPDVLASIQGLQYALAKDMSKFSLLYKYCRELRSFFQRNQALITDAPLQTYMSAIAFTDPDSIFQRHLAKTSPRQPPRVVKQQKLEEISCDMLTGHRNPVLRLACSPDGSKLVSSAWVEKLRIWDLSNGACETVLDPSHTDDLTLTDFKFSLNKKYVLANYSEMQTGGTILWDVRTGSRIGKWEIPLQGATRSDISPDSAIVVTGHHNGMALIWNIEDGFDFKVARPIRFDSQYVTVVRFSSDCTRILLGSKSGKLDIWDIREEKCLISLADDGPEVSEAYFCDEDKKVVALFSSSSLIRVWDTSIQPPIEQSVEQPTKNITTLAVSSDTYLWASGSKDGVVLVSEARSSACLLPPLDCGALEAQPDFVLISFSTDGTKVATGTNVGPICVWDIQDPNHPCINVFNLSRLGGPNHLCFTPDDKQVASAGPDNEIRLWDITESALPAVSTLDDHQGRIKEVKFSPNGAMVATYASNDLCIRLWDSNTGESIGSPLKGHTSAITCLSFSSLGTHLVSGSNDKTVRVWNLAAITAESPLDPERVFSHEKHAVTQAIMLKNNTHVVSSDLEAVRLWDLASGRDVKLEKHGPDHCIMVQSLDEQLLVSCSSTGDGSVSTLDYDTGSTSIGTDLPFESVDWLLFDSNRRLLVGSSTRLSMWGLSPMPICLGKYEWTSGEPIIAHPRFTADSNYIYFDGRAIEAPRLGAQVDPKKPAKLQVVSEDIAHQLQREHPLYYHQSSHAIGAGPLNEKLLELPSGFQMSNEFHGFRNWASHNHCIAFGSERGNVMIIRWDHNLV